MKNETKMLRGGYCCPSVDVIEVSYEGILCQSSGGSIDGSGSGGDNMIDPIDFL